MKVSDDQVLPVMTDLLAVPECLILSSTYRQFQLIIGLCQRDVPAALPQTYPGVFPCMWSMQR